MVGVELKETLASAEIEEFSPEKYDPNTQSYSLKGASVTFVFKFENKKLVYLGDADEAITQTYSYKKITPQLPVDPPTPPEPGQEYTLTFYESDGQTVRTTITITSDNPTIIVPDHDGDEGTWEFKKALFKVLHQDQK